MRKVESKKPVLTTEDILNFYIECTWNGMSDFYKVVKVTPKTVILRPVSWHTAAPTENEIAYNDPTYRTSVMEFDDTGKPVFKNEKTYRKNVVFFPDGGFSFKSPNYSGCAAISIVATSDDEAKKLRVRQYWG